MHWIPRGKWEGPRDYVQVKGDPIPWVVQVVGNIEEPGFWGCCGWRVDS
jgi:hypothetical protein